MAVTHISTPVAVPSEQAQVKTGEAAAAFVAGGLGCFTIGLMTTLTEMPALVNLKNALNWWNPAGPLTGKTGVGVIVFFLSWLIAHLVLREKNVNLKLMFVVSMALTFIGLLLTFPPVFELFAE